MKDHGNDFQNFTSSMLILAKKYRLYDAGTYPAMGKKDRGSGGCYWQGG
jgi:hypothetical protein